VSDWTTSKIVGVLVAVLFYSSGKFIGFNYLMFGLLISWTVLMILFTIFWKESEKSVAYFFRCLFRPLSYILISPDKNTRWECPRCNGSEFYSSQEQVTSGAIGGFVDNPVGGFGAMIPASYNTVVKRCKNCNTEMDEYVNTDFFNWKERLTGVGYFIYALILLFIIWDVFLPWGLDF